ncbi:hypothetical protein B1B_06208, partial [mine drainage metagenome]
GGEKNGPLHLPLLPSDLAPSPSHCPTCHGELETPKTLRRRIHTVGQTLTYRGPLLVCRHHPERPFFWVPPLLAKVAPPRRTYDLKVALLLGLESLFLEETQARARRHATLDEIGPSTGTVSLRREEFLLRAYALHRRGLPALRRSLQTPGGYLLHVDGTETAGSPVVFVAWDEWSGLVLDARVLDTENAIEIAPSSGTWRRPSAAPRVSSRTWGRGSSRR